MKKTLGIVAATMVVVLGTLVLIAGAPQAQKGAQQPMSFFITSVGKGDGANYGGLAGADAYCQSMGAAAGRRSSVYRFDGSHLQQLHEQRGWARSGPAWPFRQARRQQ